MQWIENLPIPRFLRWLQGVLSEPDGTPSSTRVLMYAFSVFSMWLVWHCFNHIFQLNDITQLTVWLSNMPMLIASLLGLIALPYGINKGSSTFSDIANMMTAAKTGKAGVVQAVEAQIEQAVAPANPANAAKPTPAVGTAGVKG
jgi:hypothetical protein